MSDTQGLLTRISALRQRLEQERGSTAPASAASEERPLNRPLERRVTVGSEHNLLLDGALRQLIDETPNAEAGRTLPAQLTRRARRVLERGRDLLDRLRSLADEFDNASADDDPLTVLYRETVAMTDTVRRALQTLPDAASAQLRICEGLEVILGVIGQRLTTLSFALSGRRREQEQVDTLVELLTSLRTGQMADLKPFLALAEAILAGAQQMAPLRFLHPGPAGTEAEQRWAARLVACHSLIVAQVVARVARLDPDLRGRAIEPVLAALVHDVGMLHVPPGILAQAGPLDDNQRRAIEAHCRVGAECVSQLPAGAWLTEAAAGHHERLDGTGYPVGLRDLQIGPITRLLVVCDTYAAMCQNRPHRAARDTRTALADTLLLAEQGTLDRAHAERLLQLSFYPIGSVVELADGPVAVVVATHLGRRDLNSPARPVVAVLTDEQGEPLPAPHFLDLAQSEDRSIVRALPSAERRRVLGRRYPEWA
jgi:HD-GYP domain-containing protein (c-di-GMP phosphodiesterase class II)